MTAFSGSKATIYSVILEDDELAKTTLLERFIGENQESHRDELKNILGRLTVIGQKTGSRDHYFKPHEGKPGDGVCALFDDPEKNLRLYCIRFGNCILIVGGGGPKPKSMRALQESPKLKEENDYMRIISSAIAQKIQEREIVFSENETELLGEFKFYDND